MILSHIAVSEPFLASLLLPCRELAFILIQSIHIEVPLVIFCCERKSKVNCTVIAAVSLSVSGGEILEITLLLCPAATGLSTRSPRESLYGSSYPVPAAGHAALLC